MKIRIVSITEYGKIDKVIKINDTVLECELKKLYECSSVGGILYLNETYIEFDNGTRIEVSATSESAFRGRSINVLIMDEFAFVPPGQAEEFWAANYPALSASVESKLSSFNFLLPVNQRFSERIQ